MIRRLALLLVPLVLLAGACSGDGNESEPPEEGPTQAPAATEAAADTGGGSSPTDLLFGGPNLFSLMSSAGSGFETKDVNPELGAVLVTAGDVPGGMVPIGPFGFTAPSEYGTMEMAATIFAGGDFATGAFGSMVMSAAALLPADLLDEVDAAWNQQISEADLEEIEAAGDLYGIKFSNLGVLDTSGLGEHAFGFHMEMDLSELATLAGASQEDMAGMSGLAFDMYGVVRGDVMLMVMVMWPSDASSDVDARALIDVMYSRAAS